MTMNSHLSEDPSNEGNWECLVMMAAVIRITKRLALPLYLAPSSINEAPVSPRMLPLNSEGARGNNFHHPSQYW